MALPQRYDIHPRPVYYPTSDGEPMAETDKHRDQAFDELLGLDLFYEDQPDVYVSGNNFIYYLEGNPKKCISPDVYVVKGVPRGKRDCYKVWEEGGRTPSVVIEITSRKTNVEDRRTKLPIYRDVLKVPEVFFFDPRGEYLKPYRLKGFRLHGNQYVELDPVNGRLHSEQLGLDLVIDGDRLRLYDPATGRMFLSGAEYAHLAEQEAFRAEQEAFRAEQQALRAEQEAQARRDAERRAEAAEAEIQRLREQLQAMMQDGGGSGT